MKQRSTIEYTPDNPDMGDNVLFFYGELLAHDHQL
jgi:hypothetical protein